MSARMSSLVFSEIFSGLKGKRKWKDVCGFVAVAPCRVPAEALAKIVAVAHFANRTLPGVVELQGLLLAGQVGIGEHDGDVIAVGLRTVLGLARLIEKEIVGRRSGRGPVHLGGQLVKCIV